MKQGLRPFANAVFVMSEVTNMFDVIPPANQPTPSATALLLFDRAMRIRAISPEIVRAAQYLDGLSDNQLAELGINRSDIEDTINRYI